MSTRRQFFGLVAAGAAAATPRLASGAGPGRDTLAQALADARAVGKPLLVLPTGADDARSQRAGRLLARFLSRATDAELAPLALAELCAAPRAELAQLAGADASDPSWETALFALVETDEPARVAALLPESSLPSGADERGNAAALATWLRARLAPDAERAEERWLHALRSLGDGALRGIDLVVPDRRPRLADVDRAAPALLAFALRGAGQPQGDLWLRRLADAAAARLWDRDPRGARWIEDPDPGLRPDPCPPCGMAVCPAPSRTFLDFYTR